MSNEEKLVRMLKYVSEHNDFYKKRIKEYGITNPLDITQWPVLTRKELQENRYNMFSDGYKSKYLCHQLKRTTSSGTSGVPVNVYWDTSDYHMSMLPLWRKRKEWYGISPMDKKVAFTLSYANQVNRLNNLVCLEDERQLLINASSLASEDAYNAVIRRILDFEPKWMYVQPFILEQLICYYRNSGLKFPKCLEHIDSVGEVLTDKLKNDAMDFFNVPISNLYGSEEQSAIAYECSHGKMHIMVDNVYVEEGAIITNINNHAFPLIRYEQGDTINLITCPEFCKCRDNSPYISSVEGRTRQSFDISGVKVNAYSLSETIDIVNNQFNGMITKYSFDYSVNAKLLKCYITIRPEDKGWAEIIIFETKKALKQQLPVDKGLCISVTQQENKVLTSKFQILTINA